MLRHQIFWAGVLELDLCHYIIYFTQLKYTDSEKFSSICLVVLWRNLKKWNDDSKTNQKMTSLISFINFHLNRLGYYFPKQPDFSQTFMLHMFGIDSSNNATHEEKFN